jgi:hypothetical protein
VTKRKRVPMTPEQKARYEESLARLRQEGRTDKDARILALREHEAAQQAERDMAEIEDPRPKPAGNGRLRCPICREDKDPVEMRGDRCYHCTRHATPPGPRPVQMVLPPSRPEGW